MDWLFQVSTLIQLKIFEKKQRKREVKANEARMRFPQVSEGAACLGPGSINARLRNASGSFCEYS